MFFHLSVPVERDEAKLEIGAPLLRAIEAIKKKRSIDPYLFGSRVDAERIPRPQNDVGILARLERADPVVEAERPRRIDRDPFDRLLLGDRNARGVACSHGLRCFLSQALRS